MPNVIQQLHPEGDTGTTIHPETEVAAITDLPTSAKSQLYAHYGVVTILSKQVGGTGIGYFSYFYINSKNTAGGVTGSIRNFVDSILTQVAGRIVCNGVLEFYTDNKPDGNTALVINACNISKSSFNFNCVQLINNGNIVNPTMSGVDLLKLSFDGSENIYLSVTETVVAIGSNAG